MAMTPEDYQARFNAYLADYTAVQTKADELIQLIQGSNISQYFANLLLFLKNLNDQEDEIKEGLRQQVIAEAEADFAIEINDAVKIHE